MGRQYIDRVLFTRLQNHRWLPTQCAHCRGWGAQRVCSPCRQRFGAAVPRCQRCAQRVADGVPVCGACVKEPPPFDRALAAVDYGHPWDHLIGQFKFHDALDLAPAFARHMADAWVSSGWSHPELLLPVPLGRARLRERGYNQSWELARRLARAARCKADATLLQRVRDTPHQLNLAPQRRDANVRDAFAVAPSRRHELHGRKVTIVDDVMTSGATAAEIARTLRDAGAAEVNLWVFARTPAPGA